MTRHMRDDDFETLLGRALKLEPAPHDLAERLLRKQPAPRAPWFLAIVSPARIAASAAILSLLMGFAMGWGNASVADDQVTEVAAVLYAANDTGDF
jgi:hypothetical protein